MYLVLNIASICFSERYSTESYTWNSYKRVGKGLLKIFAIILGFTLAVTQILVNFNILFN